MNIATDLRAKLPTTQGAHFMRQEHRVLVLLAVAATWISPAFSTSISIGSFGSAYTEDFNALASTGISNALIPDGWALVETGSSLRVDQRYAAGTGADSEGDVYSYGAAGSTERAFGTLLSNSLTPTIGASFFNNAGGTLTALTISYTGEQWRFGLDNRNAADRLDFQYSLDAASLTTGTWTDFDLLDFGSPTITGTVNTLDGNAAANRSGIGSVITGLSVANGSSFWIRWTDLNISDADDGLAVDDFSLTARGSVTSVPEPGTIALLGCALAGLAASHRRRH